MIMKRRWFVAFAFAGLVLGGTGNASATSETLAEQQGAPVEQKVAPVEQKIAPVEQKVAPANAGEPYPISSEDYQKVKPQFRPQIVDYATNEPPGTIVIDTRRRYLYLVQEGGKAKRYGVGVGRFGYGWSGVATVGGKQKWPKWHPPAEMMERDREAAKWPDGMPGGPGNPLGARALYLYQGNVDTLYRIHGTREPTTIGRAVSSGCIRMLNADVADLFERAPVGTRVVVRGPMQVTRVGTDLSKALRAAFKPTVRRAKKASSDLRKVLGKQY